MVCVMQTLERVMPSDVIENQFHRVVRETCLHRVLHVVFDDFVDFWVRLVKLTEPCVPFVHGWCVVDVVGISEWKCHLIHGLLFLLVPLNVPNSLRVVVRCLG